MTRTILLPLDGSELARHALPFATYLARAASARLVLMHAYLPKALDPQSDPELDLIREQADLASGLRERGIHATTWLSYDEPGPAIVRAASELQADAIVMSTHGRGGIGQMIYGSVAEHVAHEASVPVILVTSKSRLRWADDLPLQILVPLDGSALAEAAIGPASELATSLSARLTLLRVLDVPLDSSVPFSTGAAKQREEEAATAYLEGVAGPLTESGQHVTLRVESGNPADAIARVADEVSPSIVVMATHGRGALSRLLVESVAADTLRKVTVPVLLVRPDRPGAARIVEATAERLRV